MTKHKIGMVSLGCPKNQIDAERMLWTLSRAGYEITPDEAQADAIIVNTCGFIEAAKQEAIDAILDVADRKKTGRLKALIVTGCLAERYADEVTRLMPEVDAVVGIGGNAQIAHAVADALRGAPRNTFGPKTALPLSGDRVLTTPFYTAYLKIAEGCDNRCTFCAIPAIRGRFRSVPLETLLEEARKLADRGVRELVLVAQDTTRYGEDLYGEPRLCELLERLCEIEPLHWIRLLYTYPDRITDDLLDSIAAHAQIVPYLDIPLQHCNEAVLRRMNRRSDAQKLSALLARIRRRLPEITLRTTVMTGFPGETEEAFCELCAFLKAQRFDRLGCFAYSQEEDTPAAAFKDQVPEQVRQDRMTRVMEEQMTIAAQKNDEKIGRVLEVLVEGYDDYIKCYYGRSAADAPEIDGKVFFTAHKALDMGGFYSVKINDVLDYDLLGEAIDETEHTQ